MPIPLVGAAIAVGSSLLTWIVTRIIAIFGIGFITILGVKPLLNNVTDMLRNMLNLNTSGWSDFFQWLGVFQFDVCISIWLSAVTARLLFSGLNSKTGGMRKMRIGGGE